MNNENNNEIVVEKKRYRYSPRAWRKLILDLLPPVIIALILTRIVFALIIVPSSSMEPTLKTNSLHIAWRLPYFFGDPMPERGDVTVFYCEENDDIYVKRVIAVEGDSVTIWGGRVYLNGEILDEPYLAEGTRTDMWGKSVTYTVPEGCFFVMGDNRLNSHDSRFLENSYLPVDCAIARVIK